MKHDQEILWYGSSDKLPQQSMLQAGPVSMLYETGVLRYIRFGERELVRSVYSALRDHNWDTVDPVLEEEKIELKEDSFKISFRASYKKGPVDFSAFYEFTGDASGTILCRMQGIAYSDFMRNRIGFCILHPVTDCKGNACRIVHTDGQAETLEFPYFISPHQPFLDIKSMEWSVAPGISAVLEFSGEIFETEDQRNWTDDSYKTYCTPLSRPFPVLVRKGDSVVQEIRFRLEGRVSTPFKGRENSIRVSKFGEPLPFPKLGVVLPQFGTAINHMDSRILKQLALDHVRVDWHAAPEVNPSNKLAACAGLGWPLELVVHAQAEYPGFPEHIENTVRNAGVAVERLLLLESGAKTSSQAFLAEFVPRLRKLLPGIPIGAGTDAYFAELNRYTPPVDGLDFLSYSINPQVHAFDIASLTETLRAQRETVESCRMHAPDLEVVVSPVTLKPRFNPNATGDETQPDPGELPSQVDPRQMSLYGAGWTLGSISQLAAGGVSSITYYEAVGWKGLFQGDKDPEVPEKFHARAGQLFPVYFVMSEITGTKSKVFQPAEVSDLLRISTLWMQTDYGEKIILANHTALDQKVDISLPKGQSSLMILDAASAWRYMNEGTKPPIRKARSTKDGTRVVLPPFAIAVVQHEADARDF